MRQLLPILVGVSTLCAGMFTLAPAGAQTTPASLGPRDPYCGTWYDNAWMPSGNCIRETPATASAATLVPEKISGTITAVDGHLVTLQQANHDLVINDQPALKRELTGRVVVGRSIWAHGYWQNGIFYAERLTTAS